MTRQNPTSGASCAPYPHDDPRSSIKYKCGSGIDPNLVKNSNSTLSKPKWQRAQREATESINNQHKTEGKQAEYERSAPQSAHEHEVRIGKKNRRRRRRRRRRAASAEEGSEPSRIKVYKAAGLDTNGLWSFSQRNRAKVLAQIEPVPDLSHVRLFHPSHGMVKGK